jgi:DnaJ-class molecular chaperone
MKKSKPKEAVAEIKCPACEGTGFPKVKQPDQPGRRIFPAPCEKCGGKGRVASEGPK